MQNTKYKTDSYLDSNLNTYQMPIRRWLKIAISIFAITGLIIVLLSFNNNHGQYSEIANTFFQLAINEEDETKKQHKLAVALSKHNQEDEVARRMKFHYPKPDYPLKNIIEIEGISILQVKLDSKQERILTWGNDNAIRLFDIETGEQIGKTMQHGDNDIRTYPDRDKKYEFSFVSNDERIISWSSRGTLNIWDTATGEKLNFGKQKMRTVKGVLYDNNQDRVIAWDHNTVNFFDVCTGEETCELKESVKQQSNSGWLLYDTPKSNYYKEGLVYNANTDRVLSWEKSKKNKATSNGNWQLVSLINWDLSGRKAIPNYNDYSYKLILWDSSTSEQIGEVIERNGKINGAIFSKDGKRIFTWVNNMIEVLDAETGNSLEIKMQHAGEVKNVILNKSGNRLLSWSDPLFNNKATVYLWDAHTGEQIGELLLHDDEIVNAQFNKAEDRILSQSNGNIYHWDINTNKLLFKAVSVYLPNSSETLIPKYNKKEDRILTGHNGNIRLLNASTGYQIGTNLQNQDYLKGALFDKSDQRLITWDNSKTIRIYDAKTGEKTEKSIDHQSKINGVMFDANEERLISWGDDGKIKFWAFSLDKTKNYTQLTKDDIDGVIYNKEKNIILTRGPLGKSYDSDGEIQLLDTQTGKSVKEISFSKSNVKKAIFDCNNDRVLYWYNKKYQNFSDKISLINPLNVEQNPVHFKHSFSNINGVVFNNDCENVVTWGKYNEEQETTVKIWNTETGIQEGNDIRIKSEMDTLIFTQNNQLMLSKGFNQVHLIDVKLGKLVNENMAHNGEVTNVMFNEDKDRILSWSNSIFYENGSIKLWNTKTGKQIGKTMQHKGSVIDAFLSKNENRIFSYADDYTIKIWNAKTGEQIGETMNHEGESIGVTFDENENFIISWEKGEAPVTMMCGYSYGRYMRQPRAIHLWNAKTGKQIGEKIRPANAYKEALLLNDGQALFAYNSRQFGYWNVLSGEIIKPNTGVENHSIHKVILNKDKQKMLIWYGRSYKEKTQLVLLWDVQENQQTGKKITFDEENVEEVFFSENGKNVITRSVVANKRREKIWDVNSGAVINEVANKKNSLSNSTYISDKLLELDIKENDYLSRNDVIRLWDIEAGKQIGETIHYNGKIERVRLDNTGKRALSWDQKDSIKIWDINTGCQIGQTIKNDGDMIDAAFDDNTNNILAKDKEDTLRTWNILTGEIVNKTVTNETLTTNTLTNISSNRESILSRFKEDDPIRMWTEKLEKQEYSKTSYNIKLPKMYYDKNKKRILAYGCDNTIRIWDVQTGNQITKTMKHENKIDGAVFDGKQDCIFSWEKYGSLYLWDAYSGDLIYKFKHNLGSFKKVYFDKKEQSIIDWGYDGLIKFEIAGDLDLPKDDFKLQTQVVTGYQYNEKLDESEMLTAKEWIAKKKEWLVKAKQHAKVCEHPNQNVFLNYYATLEDSLELNLQ